MNMNKNQEAYHRCSARINLDAITYNFESLKKLLKSNVKVCCVVKADAYGHGSVQVAKTLEEKSDFFAVAALEEGAVLREAGIKKPILILSYTAPFQYQSLIELDMIPTLYNLQEAKELSAAAQKLNKTVSIHVAVDTGMGRIGFPVSEESADTVKEISLLPGIELQGVFSHYAKADYADKTCANEQTKLFNSFIEMLEKRGVTVPIKHISNSAAAIDLENQYDMVRLGILLYGMFPSDEVQKERVSLKPAMEVISHVIHVKTVSKGMGIGYGHAYVAPEERKIATVSIGYADGYSRALSCKGWVLIKGKKARITGKVCMDLIMVDVTDIEGVEVGDTVVVMGKMQQEEISAETIGELSGSINYEVICTFLPRVKRLYYKDGKLIED